MPAAPNARASGERHRIAQGIEAGRPRRVSGSVHESPFRGQRTRHQLAFVDAAQLGLGPRLRTGSDGADSRLGTRGELVRPLMNYPLYEQTSMIY